VAIASPSLPMKAFDVMSTRPSRRFLPIAAGSGGGGCEPRAALALATRSCLQDGRQHTGGMRLPNRIYPS